MRFSDLGLSLPQTYRFVLLPIGGVSKLENLPESAPDELAIAIVGPAASLAG